MKRRLMTWLFLLVLSLLVGVMAAGQVLGFARLYSAWLVIPLSLALAVLAAWLYLRYGWDFLASFTDLPAAGGLRWLEGAFLLGGAGIFLLLVFYPLANWPASPLTADLPWDAGLYHFPKAIEMIVTHSSWDLSISYGEYPVGYESLIAFSYLLNHSGLLVGTVHAVLAAFFLLAFWMLIARRTKIPMGVSLFFISLLLVGKQLSPNFDSNLWWSFWPQLTLIGKNDLLLAAALLAVLLHTPVSRQGPFFPAGLAMASMLAISVKPNAALVVLFAWFLMIYFLLRSGKWKEYRNQLLVSMFLLLPGGLWVLRNLIAQGAVISREALHLSGWSIAGNLNNPYFYRYIPQHLVILVVILLLAGLVSIFKRSLRFDALAGALLLATFALTPASAFFGATDEPAQIGWRFALALLAYVFLLLLALLEPLILPLYRWVARPKWLALPLSILVLAVCVGCIYWQRDLLESSPSNLGVLHDQYKESVGVDGYASAYDYVQKNIRDSVVIIENGLPFYLYDPGFTNSVTRSRPPDYIVYLQTAWIDPGGYPDSLGQPEWTQSWQLVYEDEEGRVYARK